MVPSFLLEAGEPSRRPFNRPAAGSGRKLKEKKTQPNVPILRSNAKGGKTSNYFIIIVSLTVVCFFKKHIFQLQMSN